MSNFTKIFLVFLIVLIGFYFKDTFFGDSFNFQFAFPKFTKEAQSPFQEEKITDNTKLSEEPAEKEPKTEEKKDETKPKETVIVYFLSVDKNGSSWFTKSIRPLPEGKSKMSYAIKNLVQGPLKGEKANGIYSEIPSSTKVLSVKEDSEKVIVDLSSDFQFGGGADSLYSRVKQLIKTSLANSGKKPVYLYIDGKQANVIGGEGIMINQPLNENSLDE